MMLGMSATVAGGDPYDPNNSVFDDSAPAPPHHPGMVPHQHHLQPPMVGAPRAMFDDDQELAANEPPPLVKRSSRPSVGSETRGWFLCFVF